LICLKKCLFCNLYFIKFLINIFVLSVDILYNNNNSVDTPKSAIVITSNRLQTVNITSYATNYLCVCNIEFAHKIITLISIYCSPLTSLTDELNELQNVLNNIRSDGHIIAIDSNAHSRVWFNRNDDQRGNEINDFIAQNNLILINNNSECPTYETTGGKSTIDLTFASLSAANKITDWCVRCEESL
jgi:hypothetical protein